MAANPSATPADKWISGVRGFLHGTFSQEGGAAFEKGAFSPDIKLVSPYSTPGLSQQPLDVPGGAILGGTAGFTVGRLFGPTAGLIGGGAGAGIGALIGALGIKPGSKTDQFIRGLGNFATNALLDEAAAGVQGPLTRQVMRVAGKAGEASGLYDRPLPIPAQFGGPRSINTIKAVNADNRLIARTMSKYEGLQGPTQEAAAKSVAAATEAYEKLAKMGVPLKGKNAAGRTINILDNHVYHWIEAGTEGSAYKTRAEVEAEARNLSTSPAGKAAITQAVRDIGTAYRKSWYAVGKELERVGFLKPGTVARMGDYYAARMYESTSHNPDDIEAWLQNAAEVAKSDPSVGISPGALKDAQSILGASGERGGVANAAKGRKVATYEERVARGAATQATPVFARSINQQTRIAARGGALQEIAANPDLATPGFTETPLPPKYTPEAFAQAQTDLTTAQTAAAAAKTEYTTAKTAAATSTDPAAVQRLEKATSDYKEALTAQRSAQTRMRSYKGLVDPTPGVAPPQNPAEYHAAAQKAVADRLAEHTTAQTAYTDAVAAYKKAKTPENELAVLKAREGVRDSGIAWANAQNKIAEVEQEIATGRSGVTRSAVPIPTGSRQLNGLRYGPLNGMIVPNHVKTALDAYLDPAPVDKGFAKLWSDLARTYKSQAMWLSFPSLQHKVKYDSVLAEGAAKDARVAFTPADVARAARDLGAFRKSGKLTPAIEALSGNTRSFVSRSAREELGKAGSSLQNVLGLKPKNLSAKTVDFLLNKSKRVVPEGIGEIERTYKIALTEALAKKMPYPEAAQKAAETIGDWTMTDPTIRLVEKYGGVPFLTARAKAFPKMASIALKHPEILQRWGHPKLGPSMAAAMGPGVQAQQQIAEPGQVPVPGQTDQNGRQMFTTDPTRVEPVTDILNLGAGIGGGAAAIGGALANVDLPRSMRQQQGESIVKPGEAPPLDSAAARFQFVMDRLQAGVLREGTRLYHAATGTTPYSSMYTEPETLARAALGVVTGARLTAPKTEAQSRQDALKNLPRAEAAGSYAVGRWNELMSGKAEPTKFPLADAGIKNVADAKARIQTAKARLKSIAEGQQFTGQEQIRAISRQVDWIFSLYHIAKDREAAENARNSSMVTR